MVNRGWARAFRDYCDIFLFPNLWPDLGGGYGVKDVCQRNGQEVRKLCHQFREEFPLDHRLWLGEMSRSFQQLGISAELVGVQKRSWNLRWFQRGKFMADGVEMLCQLSCHLPVWLSREQGPHVKGDWTLLTLVILNVFKEMFFGILIQ